MSGRYRKPYVESSVFIAFIKGEKDQGPKRDQDAKAIFDTIIDNAKAGRFKIITSALTIAEVFKNKKNPQLTEQQDEDLRPYFREDYIQIVEIDREVGERANELCRTLQADQPSGFKSLRPNDGIHIAAAEKAECDVVLAWDPDFISQAPRLTTVKPENPEALQPVIPVAKQEPLELKSAEDIESVVLPPTSIALVPSMKEPKIKEPTPATEAVAPTTETSVTPVATPEAKVVGAPLKTP